MRVGRDLVPCRDYSTKLAIPFKFIDWCFFKSCSYNCPILLTTGLKILVNYFHFGNSSSNLFITDFDRMVFFELLQNLQQFV
jgi:hypothetical protein